MEKIEMPILTDRTVFEAAEALGKAERVLHRIEIDLPVMEDHVRKLVHAPDEYKLGVASVALKAMSYVHNLLLEIADDATFYSKVVPGGKTLFDSANKLRNHIEGLYNLVQRVQLSVLADVDIREHFKEISGMYDHFKDIRPKEFEQHEISVLKDIIQNPSKYGVKDIVQVNEVGCGTGRVMTEIKKEFPHKSVIGYDVVPKMSSISKKKLHEEEFDAEVLVASAEHQPFVYNEKALNVFLFGGFGNNPSIKEHKRILGGLKSSAPYLYLSVFNAEKLVKEGLPAYNKEFAETTAIPIYERMDDKLTHYSNAAVGYGKHFISHWFTEEALKELLNQSGYEILHFEEYKRGFHILAKAKTTN